MKNRSMKTMLLTAAASALLTAAFALTAFAATSISSVSIKVTAPVTEDELVEPEISLSPSSCSITDIEWKTKLENWKPGKEVLADIYVDASDGREFPTDMWRKNVSISGAEFRSLKVSEDQMTVKIGIRYTPSVQLGTTEQAGWSSVNKTRASWKKVKYTTGYEVRLYLDDTLVKTVDVTATTLDVSQYIKETGEYYYQVRAKAKTAEERKYLLTGDYVTSEDSLVMDTADMGDIGGNWRSYSDGKKYTRNDGTSPVSQWEMILGKWYYFDANGYMVTGLIQDPATGVSYYTDEQGVMATGWQQINNLWYYFDENGAMHHGWVQSKPGEWYYLNPDGTMAVNTTVEGQYQIGSDGKYTMAP